MENYIKIKKYLDSFINYERKNSFSYKRSLKFRRVALLMQRLNIPYQKLKVIHVAGTKGKGSTSTFCAYLLAASGFKVGLYTSPHFFDFRERIQIVESHNCPRKRINCCLISRKDVIRIVRRVKPCLKKLRFSKELGKLTFFEVYTAIALKYFVERNLDFVVLETGLGGRLDATNIARPFVSIITHIGYDHMDKLGNRLRDIAYEKAGIIKKGVPLVSASQRKDVSLVLRKRCKAMKAELFVFDKDFKAHNIRIKEKYTLFNFKFHNFKLKNLKVYLKGKHQVENASQALAAIILLKEKGLLEGEIDFKGGLKEAYLRGRFEVFKKCPLVVMDIAHNPSSFSVLAQNLKLYFPHKKVILIFAASKDKDVRNMLNKIKFSSLILTTFNNPRAFSPQEIAEICKVKNAFIAKDIKEAFNLARRLFKRDSIILIGGSLFLVSETNLLLERGDCSLRVS